MSEDKISADPQRLGTVAVLRTIAQDTRDDAQRFDNRLFTGRAVGEYLGNHGAAIAAIAEILAEALSAPCAHCGETSAFPGGAR